MSILKIRDNNGNVSEILTIRGPKGEPGSDATVTADKVKSVLGYTPANQADVEDLSEAIDALNSHDWFTEGISIPTNGDLDDYTTAGKYYVGSTSIAGTIKNAPVTNSNYKMYVMVRTTDKSISQIVFALNNKIYMRSATASGAFSGWKTFATTDDIEALTIESVSESQEDGGSNIVTFSDGKTLTVNNGNRGSSIYRVTTALSSYTTATGGFTPKYRIALSTVLTQSGATEVRVGDTILRNYYTYPVGYVDADYVYVGAYASIRGTAGAAGTTPVKGTDYFTQADKEEIAMDAAELVDVPVVTQEEGESESMVMSQKAVTQLVRELLGTSGTAGSTYDTVNSVDEMTDTSKSYVLSTTGTIWRYTETTVDVTDKNMFNIDEVALDKLPDGTASKGSFSTGFIPTNISAVDQYTYTITVKGSLATIASNSSNKAGIYKIHFYDASYASISGDIVVSAQKYTQVDSTTLTVNIGTATSGTAVHSNLGSNYSKIAYIKILFLLYGSGQNTSVTNADIPSDLVVTTCEPKTSTGGTWYDTEEVPSASGGAVIYTDVIGIVDENNVIRLSAYNLPKGTYTLKYGDETFDTIGTITVN